MCGVGAVVAALAEVVAGLRVVVAGFLVVVGALDVVTSLVVEWTDVEELTRVVEVGALVAEEKAADDDSR